MKISLLNKMFILSFVILTIVGITCYSVYKSNQNLIDSAQLVNHTELVIYQSEKVISLVKDIESSARGFVITNDTDYLAPLTNATKTIYSSITQLKILVQDDPLQMQRMDSLYIQITKRLGFSNQNIEIRKKKGLASAITFVSSNQGKLPTDQIRQIIDTIQSDENKLLNQRKEINQKSTSIFTLISGLMFSIMIFLTVFLIIGTYYHLLQNKEKEKRSLELLIANADLIKAENAIRDLNQVLELKVIERTAQLESSNKELESFSYSVSHDLRAPIRAINGYTKILEEDYIQLLDQDGIVSLQAIINNSKKMGCLIDDLLAFSKLGRKQITNSEIDMYTLVKSIGDESIKGDSENKIEFLVHEISSAIGDPSLIRQVWINLISNAIKYSKYKTHSIIEIGSYSESKSVVYFISDNGAGFDMQYYDKLFGVFQRLHSQEEFEGTGIGLAIVQKVIQRHRGKVWAESIINKGTCFYFSLPNKVENLLNTSI